ncbi:MAG: bifunctional diaminohydroxyphosphoribosylaminopyrimidine deaminase/5-amino-6-(5-phosphoribosylamino)uracil reductase RibD [Chitinophagaceae bacterium]|nr:bifunctional diaminohydroxyphosphoribosylaminopyrimidine deaminase/5-amino-6-(5-phosphoribosylamino)uracil reductase RibD [Chitinophagaceae bacterium]
MRRCLELAMLGSGNVAPNPLVGSVIVHGDKIIGEGFHQQYGGPHAEVNAIVSVKEDDLHFLSQSRLYVNLEPCSHTGKTPPCADLIIEKQIPEVIIGMQDPNPLVSGKGIAKLREAGCKVSVDVLKEECLILNRRFANFIEKKRPYIILKWAQSADGFIGEVNQEVSLSNHFSKTLTHKWRSEEVAIMVGTQTALVDDPILDSRLWSQHNPLRIVLDRHLRLPETLHLFDGSIPTLVFTSKKKAALKNMEFVTIDFNDQLLNHLLSILYERQIQSVLVEGGQKLLQSFIDGALWDEARIFITPGVLGKGIAAPRISASVFSQEHVGDDTLFIQYPSR